MLEKTYYQESITKDEKRKVTAFIIIDNSSKEMSAEIRQNCLQKIIAGEINVKGSITLTEGEMFKLLLILDDYFEA